MYKRTIWQDHVEGIQDGTDMNAANFNNIEAGVMEAAALSAMNAASQRYCNDMAKNAEVVVIETELFPSETAYISIPANATRNTTDYNVVVEASSGTFGVNYITGNISGKQANGFNFYRSGTGDLMKVRFLVSGGMI